MRSGLSFTVLVFLAGIASFFVTGYLRSAAPVPETHALAAATPDASSQLPVQITVLRASGVVDSLVFPVGARAFELGSQTWVGFEDSEGNSHDYILTPDPGDKVLSVGAGVVKPALGPTAIPGATAPPPGPGPAPTPASNDPAQIADDIMKAQQQ